MNSYIPTPMPIIMHTSRGPDYCPECGKVENKIEVCKHCGYKYPEESEDSGWIFLIIFCAIIAFIWTFATVAIWVVEHDKSLVQVLQNQWTWITSLKIY